MMGRHSTTLENGTGSSFQVRSESSSGVHTLLATLDAGGTYDLVRGSSDTYLQHWVVMGDAPVVCFSTDELFDNARIKIVREGAAFKMEMVPRYNRPSDPQSNAQRSQSVGGGSATQIGKPPTGRLKRFFTDTIISFITRSPEKTLRSVNSEPVLDSDVKPL